MFNQFPREISKKRKIVYNKQDFIKYINENNTFTDVFVSLYSFSNIIQEGRKRGDYSTSIIDKVLFDFDDKNCYEDTMKLHKWCCENDIKHTILFSGRGYHIYIFVDGKNIQYNKSCLTNIHKHFIELLKINLDEHIVGDLARLARVPNTYNLKRKKWCIPLSKKQFEKGHEFILEMAEKQNLENHIIIGRKLFDVKRFDYKTNENFDEILNINIDTKILDGKIRHKLPKCILYLLQLLKEKEKSWNERYLVILYFREKGYLKSEVISILKEYLSEKKLKHCVVEERQPYYIFSRSDLIFPNCSLLQQKGYCKIKKSGCNPGLYK